MKNIFAGENILEFIKVFPDDQKCREFISNQKWKDGYKCSRCDNSKYVYFEKHNTRECTKCRYKESATAGTLFHKVKFGIQKAFCIAFEMTCTTKGISSTQAAKRYGITQKTSWLFMQKVRLAMKSSKLHPMRGNVQADEFVLGGKETGKQGRSYDSKKTKVACAVELTEDGKIKRGYGILIEDYSAKSIKPLFDQHISIEATVTTDKWTAYKAIGKTYNITQIKSIPGKNFKEIHTIIHQIKTAIRTIQSHVNKGHLQKYLDEYFYRLNRSIYKNSIFDNIFKRLVSHPHRGWKQIVVIK
jgi:ISXO2-like transposase domain/Transposase zinc-ribbon domain